MATVVNDRLLFVHVPKTAGNWVVEAMTQAGVEFEEIGWHPEWPEVAELARERFAFAFVRDPLSWLCSIWRWHRTDSQHRFLPFGLWIDMDLEPFLERVSLRPGVVAAEAFERILGPHMDFVGRYEYLQDNLAHALWLAGERFDEEALWNVPPLNVNPVAPKDVSAEVQERVRETQNAAVELLIAPEARGVAQSSPEAPLLRTSR